jgi:hypothetical protein
MGFQAPNPLVLSGSISPSIIIDPGLPPADIIKVGTPFQVKVDWEIHGTAVPLVAGTFRVQVFFESIGPGPETVDPPAPINVPVASVPLLPGPQRQYTINVPVPGALLTPGAYNMVALLTYLDVSNNPGPMAGFSDEKILQVFP